MKAIRTMLRIDVLTLILLLMGSAFLAVAAYRWWTNHQSDSRHTQAPNLQELIGDLRHQLLEAGNERRASGEQSLFHVGKCDIEVNVAVKASDTIKGGFTYEVVTAERASQYSTEQIQKITLHLESVERREVVVPPSDPNSIK